MEEKDARTGSRLELADYLENLSEQLRRGVLEARGRSWTVPEDLDVRMEFKEKKGRLVVKLKWSWATREDEARPSRDQAGPGRGDLKTVKKRLGAAFKALQQEAGPDALPDERTVADFVGASRAFAALAAPDWQGAIKDYLDHLAALEQAAATRQPEVLGRELKALQDCMAACHREFKSGGQAAG